jgi:hypothetical protein
MTKLEHFHQKSASGFEDGANGCIRLPKCITYRKARVNKNRKE